MSLGASPAASPSRSDFAGRGRTGVPTAPGGGSVGRKRRGRRRPSRPRVAPRKAFLTHSHHARCSGNLPWAKPRPRTTPLSSIPCTTRHKFSDQKPWCRASTPTVVPAPSGEPGGKGRTHTPHRTSLRQTAPPRRVRTPLRLHPTPRDGGPPSSPNSPRVPPTRHRPPRRRTARPAARRRGGRCAPLRALRSRTRSPFRARPRADG
jgi:hypothetical protein